MACAAQGITVFWAEFTFQYTSSSCKTLSRNSITLATLICVSNCNQIVLMNYSFSPAFKHEISF